MSAVVNIKLDYEQLESEQKVVIKVIKKQLKANAMRTIK